MKLLTHGALALALLAGSALAAPVSAQQRQGQIEPPPPACNRTCLEAIANQYLAAMVTHDPTKGPIAKNARYTENSIPLDLPDGIWRTASGLTSYRLFISDPKLNTIAMFTRVLENGVPVLMSTRLEVEDGKITKIESMVARASATGGRQSPLPGQPPLAPTDRLGDSPRPQFLQTLAPSERRSREDMVAIANSYFSALENNDGSRKPPFAPTCHRLENGGPTTNNPVAPARDTVVITVPTGATPTVNVVDGVATITISPAPTGGVGAVKVAAGRAPAGVRGAGNMGCAEGFAAGAYRIDTRLKFRRYLAVDEERGLVYARIIFDHDGSVREYRDASGTVRNPRQSGPFTWDIAEVFQIKNGMIDQVEALLVANPYGIHPGWDDGIKMPSYGY